MCHKLHHRLNNSPVLVASAGAELDNIHETQDIAGVESPSTVVILAEIWALVRAFLCLLALYITLVGQGVLTNQPFA